MTPGRARPDAPASPHAEPLEALGLASGAARLLAAYLDRLAAWSRRVNLTAARTPLERVDVLVRPALPLAPLLEGHVLDVGAGNGSPGLVLAVLRPELAVSLLEPRLRRWAFLREAARATGLPRLRVLRGRYQDYAGAPCETLLLRALAAPVDALAPLLTPGGQLLTSGAAQQGTGRLAWIGTVGSAPHQFQRYRSHADVPRET